MVNSERISNLFAQPRSGWRLAVALALIVAFAIAGPLQAGASSSSPVGVAFVLDGDPDAPQPNPDDLAPVDPHGQCNGQLAFIQPGWAESAGARAAERYAPPSLAFASSTFPPLPEPPRS